MENINTEQLSEDYINATLGLTRLQDDAELYLENDEEAELQPLLGHSRRSVNDAHILRSSITVKPETEKVYTS